MATSKQVSLYDNPFHLLNEKLEELKQLVIESNQAKPDRHDPNKRLDAKQAAEHLGLSLQTTYFLCSDEGQKRNPPLPFHKPAKKLVFFRNELDEWLKKKKQRRSDLIPG